MIAQTMPRCAYRAEAFFVVVDVFLLLVRYLASRDDNVDVVPGCPAWLQGWRWTTNTLRLSVEKLPNAWSNSTRDAS